VLDAVANAELLIIPSEWYEGFPMVIAESFACGTPVLASRIGSLEELVQEDITGRKFTAKNAEELAQAVNSMIRDQPLLCQMRANARSYFEAHLTEEQNFAELMRIYAEVLSASAR
jgi:glycosyltransferase involved in cell wall biosynthesis